MDFKYDRLNKAIQKPSYNALFVLFLTIVSSAILMTSDLTGLGLAAVATIWIPAVIGVLTLIIYFVSRLFFKKMNWVISLIGVIWMLKVSIQYHWF